MYLSSHTLKHTHTLSSTPPLSQQMQKEREHIEIGLPSASLGEWEVEECVEDTAMEFQWYLKSNFKAEAVRASWKEEGREGTTDCLADKKALRRLCAALEWHLFM